MLRALALSMLLVAGASAAERRPQHDLVATSHGKKVQASLGSHCTPTNGAMVCADKAYPLPAAKRLPMHGGGRIRLDFGAEPVEIHPDLRDRRSRSVLELNARGSGRHRRVRLPRVLPRGSDRLGVFVSYERGSADFEIDLKRHRH
jgi:hypothetical protein